MDISLFGEFQGPIPSFVTKALILAGQNKNSHRDVYLCGHSQYNKRLDCMALTQAGADHHVDLIMSD